MSATFDGTRPRSKGTRISFCYCQFHVPLKKVCLCVGFGTTKSSYFPFFPRRGDYGKVYNFPALEEGLAWVDCLWTKAPDVWQELWVVESMNRMVKDHSLHGNQDFKVKGFKDSPTSSWSNQGHARWIQWSIWMHVFNCTCANQTQPSFVHHDCYYANHPRHCHWHPPNQVYMEWWWLRWLGMEGKTIVYKLIPNKSNALKAIYHSHDHQPQDQSETTTQISPESRHISLCWWSSSNPSISSTSFCFHFRNHKSTLYFGLFCLWLMLSSSSLVSKKFDGWLSWKIL